MKVRGQFRAPISLRPGKKPTVTTEQEAGDRRGAESVWKLREKSDKFPISVGNRTSFRRTQSHYSITTMTMLFRLLPEFCLPMEHKQAAARLRCFGRAVLSFITEVFASSLDLDRSILRFLVYYFSHSRLLLVEYLILGHYKQLPRYFPFTNIEISRVFLTASLNILHIQIKKIHNLHPIIMNYITWHDHYFSAVADCHDSCNLILFHKYQKIKNINKQKYKMYNSV